nr:extracellular matrix/biofilm biosynthesis regulator RemA family protein [Fastidiosipila sanguinis]
MDISRAFSLIGYGNLVQTSRILAMVGPDSAPGKRMIQDARDRFALIDATAGKKTKTVLVMDSDHVILSAWDAEKILANQVLPEENA